METIDQIRERFSKVGDIIGRIKVLAENARAKDQTRKSRIEIQKKIDHLLRELDSLSKRRD
jgi:archaellum component FlaC